MRSIHVRQPRALQVLGAAIIVLSASRAWAADYSGGSGASGDPYRLSNAADLLALAHPGNSGDWDKHFLLTNDIEMEDSVGFSPIGNETIPFTGLLDGDNHVVSNLVMERDDVHLGVFGYIAAPAQIKNLGLVGGAVRSTEVLGYVHSVGGLVGYAGGGSLDSCYVDAPVAADHAHTGGLAGCLINGAATNCSASGNVTGNGPDTGGLVGNLTGSALTNCRASGDVVGWDNVGGLAGAVDSASSIVDCEASGRAGGAGGSMGYYIGGLIGMNGGEVSFSQASGPVFGSTEVGGLIGLNDWSGVVVSCDATGEVQGESSLGGLMGSNWGSLLSCRAAGAVVGYMDGGSRLGGLIGNNGGTVNDCSAEGAITGYSDIGGLVGDNGGVLTGCFASNKVSGGETVGGLSGSNSGVLNACYAVGEVEASSQYAGGLIGRNWSGGLVASCFAASTVTGADAVGGLVGQNLAAATASSCFASGAATGNNEVGGIVGSNYGALEYCYALGTVWGSTNLGGLVGANNAGASTTALFWDVDVGGPDNGIGTGLPTQQMKRRSTFESAGWDFTGPPPLWYIVEDLSYPQLVGIPMPIDSAEALQSLAFAPNGTFFLTRDIDARETASWADKSGSTGFQPIGTDAAPFTGLLDGRGRRIVGLCVQRSGLNGAGLFGRIGPGGAVRNLSLESVSIVGGNQVGGLAGANEGAIERCCVQGLVSGAQETGGLVGLNGGVINESYASASVAGVVPGGLVGVDNGGAVSASFWDAEFSGILASGGGLGLSTRQMQAQAAYAAAGWDMTRTWALSEGLSYPYFRNSAPLRITAGPPRLINADTADVGVETFSPSVFITMGGGAYPAWNRAASAGLTSVTASLKQEAINRLVVSALSEQGAEMTIARFQVYESNAFPSEPSAVVALTLYPAAAALAPEQLQGFACIATFANGATGDVTQAVAWNASGGVITSGGLYTHVGGAATIQALLHTDQGWRYSNPASITDAKLDGSADKSGFGQISGVVRSNHDLLALPAASATAYQVLSSLVAGQHPMYDVQGNYAFMLPENIYHFEANHAGFRSEFKRGGILLDASTLYYSGQVLSARPLRYDFYLRPNDAQAPWVYFVEPPADCVVNTAHIVATAVNADKYSELAAATFTLNTATHDVLDRISSTGFYRDSWALQIGANVLHLFSMDTEGNASERTIVVTYDPDDPGSGQLPPPEGPPATACVRMAIANLANGMAVRGNAVTLLAEALSGDLADVDAVSFELRGLGTGGAWSMLGATVAAPHAIAWNADAYPPGPYQLRAAAISRDGCVDSAAEELSVILSPEAPYFEQVQGGAHVLTAPVSPSAELSLALWAGGRFARVLLPAGAVAADDVLTASFPAATGFSPALNPRQRDAGLYLELGLASHVGNFLGGKRAVLHIGYPDADEDDLLDGSGLRVPLLEAAFLAAPTAAFSVLPASALMRSKGCVAGETTHFSVFGVVEEQPAPSLTLMTETLPSGAAGASYAAALEAAGGVPPYLWTVLSGTLPDGLSAEGGAIDGIPTAAGVYTFTLQVADSQSVPDTASRPFTIAVYDAAQPTATVTRSAGQAGIANALPLSWDVVFSEAVTGFEASDIMATGTAAQGVEWHVSGSGAHYALEATVLPYDGVLRPRVPENAAFAGLLGNRASESEAQIWIDRKAPLASITCSYPGAHPSDGVGPVVVTALPLSFPLIFDEIVTGLGPEDVSFAETIPGLAYSVQGSGKQYLIVVSHVGAPSTITPMLASGGAVDIAGNGNAAAVYAGRVIEYHPDARRTVTLNQRTGQADPASEFPILFDIVFSEVVTDFTVDDVAYVDIPGSAPAPVYEVQGSGASYILRVTDANGDGRMAFHIPENVVPEGNQASSSQDNQVSFLTAPPAVSLGAPSETNTLRGPVSVAVNYANAAAIALTPSHIVLEGEAAVQVGQVLITGSGVHKRVVTLANIRGHGTLRIRIAPGSALNAVGKPDEGSSPSIPIQVNGLAAAFSASPTSGGAPLQVQFQDESHSGAAAIDAWLWNFGDGETDNGAAPTHLYETPGAYTVSLVVTSGAESDFVIRTNYIHVFNSTPASNATALFLCAAMLGILGAALMHKREKVLRSSSRRLVCGVFRAGGARDGQTG